MTSKGVSISPSVRHRTYQGAGGARPTTKSKRDRRRQGRSRTAGARSDVGVAPFDARGFKVLILRNKSSRSDFTTTTIWHLDAGEQGGVHPIKVAWSVAKDQRRLRSCRRRCEDLCFRVYRGIVEALRRPTTSPDFLDLDPRGNRSVLRLEQQLADQHAHASALLVSTGMMRSRPNQ
jgi:hypothetical protein